MKFDDLIREHGKAGRESWHDLTEPERQKLVRQFFEEFGEWGDALYGSPGVLDSFADEDYHTLGFFVAAKMRAHAKTYIEKELRKQTVFKRERDEVEAQLDAVDPHWRERFSDWTLAEQYYAKELSA